MVWSGNWLSAWGSTDYPRYWVKWKRVKDQVFRWWHCVNEAEDGRNDLLCVINCSSQLHEMSKITKYICSIDSRDKTHNVWHKIQRYMQAGWLVRQDDEEKDDEEKDDHQVPLHDSTLEWSRRRGLVSSILCRALLNFAYAKFKYLG